MKEWESGARCDLKYVKRRKRTYVVWEWFIKARSKELRVSVSGRLLHVFNSEM